MAGKYRIEVRGNNRDLVNQLNKVLDQIEEDMKTQATPATTTQSKSNG